MNGIFKAFFFFAVALPMFSAAAGEYKVGSFNILGGDVSQPDNAERAAVGSALVGFYGFDIIGFQEMRKPQAEIYLKAGEYAISGEVVAPNIEVPTWMRWGNFIFYKKEKFELLKEGHFWLSPTPETPSKGWDEKQYRICNYVKLRDKADGSQIYFFNLHQGLTEKSRSGSMRVIVDKLREILKSESGAAVFMTGDFNACKGEESISYLLSAGILKDSWDVSKTPPFGSRGTFVPKFGNKTSCKGEAKTENKIDYIFVSPNVSVKKCAVIANNVDGTFASDHLPIIAVVEVEN